jgi:UDP-glucose 4-epimerase
MRVAITGSSGFIGTNLMEYLAKTEPDTELVLIDIVPPVTRLPDNARFVYADIRNLSSLLGPLDGVDELYHLAGLLGTNIVGANNVMDACRLAGVKRVYNVAKPHFDGYAENSYTLTKHAGELIGQLYQQKYGIDVATVRWLNAVGPYQHLYPVRKFLPMMIVFALRDLPLEIYGDGTQTIDPIDVYDLSRFTVHACRNLGDHPVVVDLGSGVSVSCNDAAETILSVVKGMGFKSKSEIIHIPMREGEKPGVNLVADMSYWDSIGMKTEVPFEESIIKTVRHVAELPNWKIDNALAFYGKI